VVTSTCLNCGNAKLPPYTDHWCVDCMKATADAREKAISDGQSPTTAAKAALAMRAFNPNSLRTRPDAPLTMREATLANIRKTFDIDEGLS